jgi:hypothetical protein
MRVLPQALEIIFLSVKENDTKQLLQSQSASHQI